MSAQQLIQYLTWACYLVIFVNVTVHAVRRPLRANIDIALFFTVFALIILIRTEEQVAGGDRDRVVTLLLAALVLALPYLLLRLVDDFAFVPVWIKRTTLLILVLLISTALLYPVPYPLWLILLMFAYLTLCFAYDALIFVRAAQQARGVTRRRMASIGIGTALLVLIFLLAGVSRVLPGFAELIALLSGLLSLGSALFYYLGFVTPLFLRRAWQEPELRAFLGRAASLPRLPDTALILRKLEEGAAYSLGAPNARIGLWDSVDGMLAFTKANGEHFALPVTKATPAAQAFREQRPIFDPDVQDEDPVFQATNRRSGVTALMAAPISAAGNPLGVLTIYAPRVSIFAADDLALVQLLADQAAVILESRALIDEAARVQAREETIRLKDDFLSAAAHDLKTPLTTLIAQAQLLERRALRNPNDPTDVQAIQRMIREGQRLKNLVQELLDAMRAEQGTLLGQREQVDLTALAGEICTRHQSSGHNCVVVATDAVVGMFDRNRISQLIENLVENAVKYSPDGGQIQINVQQVDDQANIQVCDMGIGIPAVDIPHVFDRFYRGSNVDDRRFAGMGLGLFICRGIVEQHGGRIWASRNQGQGTTIHLLLPLDSKGTTDDR